MATWSLTYICVYKYQFFPQCCDNQIETFRKTIVDGNEPKVIEIGRSAIPDVCVHSSNSELLTVKVKVTRFGLKGLLDTETTLGPVNAVAVQRLNSIALLTCEFVLSPVNGRKLRVTRFMVVGLELDKVVLWHLIVVIKCISYDFRIGHDVFQKCKCVIDFTGKNHVCQRKARQEVVRSSTFVSSKFLTAYANNSLEKFW